MSPASNPLGAPLPSVAILGVDAMLAARPATPVQLAHACQAAGYAAVYPATWGDELLATACMRKIAGRDDAAIFCACPHVSDALLEVGSDLARFLVPLVPPPVACARYLRALYGYNRVRITYIGACPGAHDPAIDAVLTPVQFFGVLTQMGIALEEQPEVFESVLPPDRRRHRSAPGGAPTPETLAAEGGARTLEEIRGDDWKTELAQRLLSKQRALFDVATALGCHCAGARPGVAPEAARPSVIALEPPRASSDVIDQNVAVDVDRTLPVIVPRVREVAPAPPATLPDEPVAATPPASAESTAIATDTIEPSPDAPWAAEAEPGPLGATEDALVDAVPVQPAVPTPLVPDEETVPEEETPPRRKAAAPVVARAAQTVPLTRTESGQVLPRAYAARRRTPSDGTQTITAAAPPPEPAIEEVQGTPTPPPPSEQPVVSQRSTPRSVTVPIPADEPRPVPPPPSTDHGRAAIVTGAATLAIALVAFMALRDGNGRVTTESSGIAAPAAGVLDSLPPLPFPLPNTTATVNELRAERVTVVPEASRLSADSARREEPARITKVPPSRGARAVPPRTRRRSSTVTRRRPDSVAQREALRRAADSAEREAIRRELEHRRARLDSIARSLEPDPTRPRR
jgi:hypothetical protein